MLSIGVSEPFTIGVRPSAVLKGGRATAMSHEWCAVKGVLTNATGAVVWEGQPRSYPVIGRAIGEVRTPAIARNEALTDAKVALSRVSHTRREVASEPTGVKMTYRGEWMHSEQAMRVQAPDGKKYAWIVSREIPAMACYDGSIDDAVPSPASWLKDGQIDLATGAKRTKKENDLSTYVRPSRVIDAHFESLGSTPLKDGFGRKLGSRVLRVLNSSSVDTIIMGTSIGITVVSMGAKYLWKRHKAAKLAARAKGISASSASTPSASGGKAPGKAPMPGWPAINFRGGKRAKTKKAALASDADSELSLDLLVEEGFKASFDMTDSSVAKLSAKALSAVVRDADGDIIWATSQLFVPSDPKADVLIPTEVQAAAYAIVLLDEADGYIDFISEPEASSTTKDFRLTMLCPHCGEELTPDGMCPDCYSESG